MEAFDGAVSAKRAIGSTFSRHTPSAPRTSYLYRAASQTPSTNRAHTPEPGTKDIASPAQELKSPLTRTSCAFGAQSANRVPSTSPRPASGSVTTCEPRDRQQAVSVPRWNPSRSRPVSPPSGSCIRTPCLGAPAPPCRHGATSTDDRLGGPGGDVPEGDHAAHVLRHGPSRTPSERGAPTSTIPRPQVRDGDECRWCPGPGTHLRAGWGHGRTSTAGGTDRARGHRRQGLPAGPGR